MFVYAKQNGSCSRCPDRAATLVFHCFLFFVGGGGVSTVTRTPLLLAELGNNVWMTHLWWPWRVALLGNFPTKSSALLGE